MDGITAELAAGTLTLTVTDAVDPFTFLSPP